MRRAAAAWEVSPRNLICGMIAILGVTQFVAAVALAMHVYPGGYDIANHFLSDLGRTRTIAGLDNSFCSGLFNCSVILLGLSLLPFVLVLSGTIDAGRSITASAGFASALALVGIGATPCDRYWLEHDTAFGLWLLSTLVFVAAFFAYVRGNRITSAVLAVVTVGVLAAAWKYVLAGGHSDHVVFQKVLVVACACWLGVVVLAISIVRVTLLTSLRERQARLATRYIERLERGHRRPLKRAEREM